MKAMFTVSLLHFLGLMVLPQGAVAVATPAHRMTRELLSQTAAHVMEAATRITRKLGFEPPKPFLILQERAAA